jgi:hypothetical protein
MILNSPWVSTDISLPIEALIPFQPDLAEDTVIQLRKQISTQLKSVVSIHSHGQTPERPSRDRNNPKVSTEHWVDRNSSKLLICIGESFTWTEGLYGMASGASIPIVNTLYQNFLTSHGRLAARYNCDLRSVTYPGNSNSLMLEILKRILDEIKEINRWKEILVLQQFTDRSRCEENHTHTPWMTKFIKNSNWSQSDNISKISYYQNQELFLLNRLSQIIKDYEALPAKFFVWRNFNPWIVDWNNEWKFKQILPSMDEFKHIVQGKENFPYSIQCAAGFYSNFLSVAKNQKDLEWLEKEISYSEYHYNFHSINEFGGHPSPACSALWAEHLYNQGFKFSNEQIQ